MTKNERYPLNHFNDFQAVLAKEFGPFTKKGAFQYDLRQQSLVDRMVAGERIDDADVEQTLAAMLTMTAYLAERYNRSLRNIAMSAVCSYVDTDEYLVMMSKLDISQDTTPDQYRPEGVTSSTGDRPDLWAARLRTGMTDRQRRELYEGRWPTVSYENSVEGRIDADMAREAQAHHQNVNYWTQANQELRAANPVGGPAEDAAASRWAGPDASDGGDAAALIAQRLLQDYARPMSGRVLGGPYNMPNLGPTAAETVTELMKDAVRNSVTEPIVPTPELNGGPNGETVAVPVGGTFWYDMPRMSAPSELPPTDYDGVTNPYLPAEYAEFLKKMDERPGPSPHKYMYGSQVLRYPHGALLCLRCLNDVAENMYGVHEGLNVGAAKCGECGHNEYTQTTER